MGRLACESECEIAAGILLGLGGRTSDAEDFSKDLTRSITDGRRVKAGAAVELVGARGAVGGGGTGLNMLLLAVVKVASIDVGAAGVGATTVAATACCTTETDEEAESGLLVLTPSPTAPLIPLILAPVPGRADCLACILFILEASASRRAFEAASSKSAGSTDLRLALPVAAAVAG